MKVKPPLSRVCRARERERLFPVPMEGPSVFAIGWSLTKVRVPGLTRRARRRPEASLKATSWPGPPTAPAAAQNRHQPLARTSPRRDRARAGLWGAGARNFPAEAEALSRRGEHQGPPQVGGAKAGDARGPAAAGRSAREAGGRGAGDGRKAPARPTEEGEAGALTSSTAEAMVGPGQARPEQQPRRRRDRKRRTERSARSLCEHPTCARPRPAYRTRRLWNLREFGAAAPKPRPPRSAPPRRAWPRPAGRAAQPLSTLASEPAVREE